MSTRVLRIIVACLLCACGGAPLSTQAHDLAPADATHQADLASSFDAAFIVDSGVDSAIAPDIAIATTCTSGKYWTNGNTADPLMNPGGTCISCHEGSGSAPVFNIAGTVYPTLHEPTDCDGVAGAQIIITDGNSTTFTMTSNMAGNFACGDTAANGFQACKGLVLPIEAKVVFGGKTNVSTGTQMGMDCNSCHNVRGAIGAPGRVTILSN